jgi:hypothetical protein
MRSTASLFRRLILKPPQPVAETCVLCHHRPDLRERVLRCVIPTNRDSSQHADIVVHRLLVGTYPAQFGKYALKWGTQKF